jgi:hypothetical protein
MDVESDANAIFMFVECKELFLELQAPRKTLRQ